jgi:hypothetical protein
MFLFSRILRCTRTKIDFIIITFTGSDIWFWLLPVPVGGTIGWWTQRRF